MSGTLIPLEAAVVRRIKDYLDAHDCFWWKPCGVPAGTPDVVGCYRGRFFAIEVKRQRNGPYGVTKLQQYKMDQIEECDGYVCVATTVDDVRELFALIDRDIIEARTNHQCSELH